MALPLLIKVGRLLPQTEQGSRGQRQGILIEDGVVQAIDAWDAFGSDDTVKVLDASRYTAMPGLIDAHTHVVHSGDPDEDWRLGAVKELPATTALKAAKNALRHLEMGVTTIRDLGARDWVDIALRDAIDAGWQQGPRMLVAGHGITATGGHMDARKFVRPGIPTEALGTLGAVANSPDEARAAAWEQLMRGADVLKLNATLSEYVRASGAQCSPELTFEAMKAVCDVAHGANRKVAAHCHGGPGVQAALDAGVDTFEHGRFLSEELLEQMAAKNVFLVPTLSPEARVVDADDPPKDPATRRWYEMATETMYTSVERAYKHGVRVVAGSDAGMPYVYHGGVSFEIAQLARAGLSTQDVLASATRVAAQALGLGESVGQLRVGFAADVLILEGDPEKDVTVLQDKEAIVAVIQQGRVVYDRADDKRPFQERKSGDDPDGLILTA